MTKEQALAGNLASAADFLERTLAATRSDIQRAATIQAFEFCFELGWKLMQERLRNDGIDVATPRAAFRAAGDAGYIESVERWLGYLAARNLTSHTYNQALAAQVYEVIAGGFLPSARALIETS